MASAAKDARPTLELTLGSRTKLQFDPVSGDWNASEQAPLAEELRRKDEEINALQFKVELLVEMNAKANLERDEWKAKARSKGARA